MTDNTQLRVCVVGAGTRFLSGITYYTIRLANALARSHRVSAILMRQLLPARFYPGRERVGADLTQQTFDPAVPVFDGVDWFWVPSLAQALAFMRRERPDVVLFEWWTGATLHTYLALALAAKMQGARVVIELNEVLDTGEARVPLVRPYVRAVAPLLMRLADGFVVYTEQELAELSAAYDLGARPLAVIPMGPFDQYQPDLAQAPRREAPEGCCNLLFFGTIRPYKGLEDLVVAFNAIPPEEIDRYWLTVVGETWEGWTLPAELIAASPYRHRITFVNRYVSDEETAGFFAGADVVVLPYTRASAAGPPYIAMSWGLPLVTTNVGGTPEAVADYDGVILVPPRNPAALREALVGAAEMRGQRFTDPHSWEATVERYNALFARILPTRVSRREAAAILSEAKSPGSV